MNTSLHYLVENSDAAKRLAEELAIAAHNINIHTFPDGENKVRVTPVTGTAIVYARLNKPNEKLIQLAFAASALRNNGASRVILLAPYLCYMRQDKAFQDGEAVSQRVVGKLLATNFDKVITVDPHLHRIDNLQEVFPNCQTQSLLATDPIAESLNALPDKDNTILVGPDGEAEQWVSAIAEKTGMPFIIGKKIRRGDRDIAFELPDDPRLRNSHAVIVDDVISSGTTITHCAEALKLAGAATIDVIATHALCSQEDLELIHKSGVSGVRSTDSVTHSTNDIYLAPLLAKAIQGELV